MKLEKIKDSSAWKLLANNSKFIEEFEKAIRKCSYHVKPNELKVELSDKKIKLSYDSKINNRDLDSQFKSFTSFEFFLDNDNNLIINEVSGRLESNYGYDFKNTFGGKLITNYSCEVYDEDGIELSYQSYVDKYVLDNDTFNNYQNDLEKVVTGIYNPGLYNKDNTYPKPNIIGEDGRFLKKNRTKDNLGIIEVFKCTLGKDNSISSNKEYYFNTFFDGTYSNSPELIHIMNGFPFATINNQDIRIKDDFAKLGLTGNNYQDIARERFLKELKESREKQVLKNQTILEKYDVMIEKVEKELGINNKTI